MNGARRSRCRFVAAVLVGVPLALGCTRDSTRLPPPASAHEALATLRRDLDHQLAELPPVASGSAAERARLGELAARGRTLLRKVGERPAPLAPEVLAPFLASLDDPGAGEVTARRATFQGRAYEIVSREVTAGDGSIWLEIIDPAGSPELLAAFEVERATAAASSSGGRFHALDVGSFPGVRSSPASPPVPRGQVAHTLHVLVGDRLLVAARATSGVDPESLTVLASALDLDGLARVAAAASAATPRTPEGGPPERAGDG
ncbi:MAG: hypothetical protein IPK07_33745 [Deltaproteobacteria bacterium]|nr:hypothetical protein [Deltaproteobacteria bacterium]